MDETLSPRADAVLNLLGALGANVEQAVGLLIPGEPYAKSRPRFRRDGRTYPEPKDVIAENALAWRMRRVVRRASTKRLALVGVFFRSTNRKVDVDNLIKHVLDAGNDVAWADDGQVLALTAIVHLGEPQPHSVIAWAPL